MDTLKNLVGNTGSSNNEQQQQQPASNEEPSSGGGGGLMDKVNSALGGGKASEKNEDYLDKGVDLVQERVLGQGPQNNESAIEQAKDEHISDCKPFVFVLAI
jgi:hypothetical protein